MLDVGQVIEIVPGEQPNDEKLLRLGLLKEVGAENPVQCGRCGIWLLNDGFLNRHGRIRHDQDAVAKGRSEAPESDLETAAELGRLKMLEEADEHAGKNLPLNLD